MKLAELGTPSLPRLLDPAGFDCDCGRHHGTSARHVVIQSGALDRIAALLTEDGYSRPLVVAERNTWDVAGRAVCAHLSAAGLAVASRILSSHRPEPNEHWLGSIMMGIPRDRDCVVVVGSGTLGDLCKMAAGPMGLPLVTVATAPSMDGFLSDTASMLVGGLKTSLDIPGASMIIADTQLLAQAPQRMIQAGLGDMLAKYVSICEWRISHLVTGEYYCPAIAELVRESLRQCVQAAPTLLHGDETAAKAVMNGLCLSGVCMSFAGISRPASGIEHYFSHVWEMRALAEGREYDLHGIQVGVGTLLALRIFERLRSIQPDRERALASFRSFDRHRWQALVRRSFGRAADDIIAQNRHFGPQAARLHGERLENLLNHWDDILAITEEELPPPSTLEHIMRAAQLPMTPADLGIGREELHDSFLATRDVRDKYIVSQLLWDIGWLDEVADELFGKSE